MTLLPLVAELRSLLLEGIPSSTMYAAVDETGVVQAKGSAKAMRQLVKKNKGWRVWNSPRAKVGDTLSNAPENEGTS